MPCRGRSTVFLRHKIRKSQGSELNHFPTAATFSSHNSGYSVNLEDVQTVQCQAGLVSGHCPTGLVLEAQDFQCLGLVASVAGACCFAGH